MTMKVSIIQDFNEREAIYVKPFQDSYNTEFYVVTEPRDQNVIINTGIHN